MCVNALEYEPCLARVRILMEFLTRAHLVSGRPAQKSTISLPFPKGWPQHFPTSQPAAPLMLCFLTPHSGLRDVVTPCYTTTPHQWHNPPPCPSPPSPGWRNPGSAHTSSLKFKTRWGVCVCVCVRARACVLWFVGGQSQVWPLFLFTFSLSSWLLRMEELGGGTHSRECQVQPTQNLPFSARGCMAGATSAATWRWRTQGCLLKPISQWWEPKRTGQGGAGGRGGGGTSLSSQKCLHSLTHWKAFLSTDYVLRLARDAESGHITGSSLTELSIHVDGTENGRINSQQDKARECQAVKNVLR